MFLMKGEQTMEQSKKDAIISAIIAELAARGVENIELRPATTVKTNDVVLDGVSFVDVNAGARSISPTVYFSEDNDNESTEAVAKRMVQIYLDNTSKTAGINLNLLSDPDYIRAHMLPCVINTKANAGLLTMVPSRPFLDLSVILRVKVNESPDGIASFVLNNNLANQLGFPENGSIPDEWYKAAMENLGKLEGEIISIADLLATMGVPVGDDEIPMYAIRKTGTPSGASAILDTSLLHRAAFMLGVSSFLIAPSSTKEIMAVLCPDPDYLTGIIQEVNDAQVAPDEVLSDHVYLYDDTMRSVQMA
jgi:hypothetical protein